MSHVAAISIEVKDLDALKAACDQLGLEFKENKKTFKWFGTWVNDYHGNDAAYKHGVKTEDYGKCDHAIGVKNNPSTYEVGVIKSENGYKLIYDFYAGGHGLEQFAGKNCDKLKCTYSEEIVKRQMSKLHSKGFNFVKREQTQDGRIKITYRKS